MRERREREERERREREREITVLIEATKFPMQPVCNAACARTHYARAKIQPDFKLSML